MSWPAYTISPLLWFQDFIVHLKVQYMNIYIRFDFVVCDFLITQLDTMDGDYY